MSLIECWQYGRSPKAGVFGWAVEGMSRVTATSYELSSWLKRVEVGGIAGVPEWGCFLNEQGVIGALTSRF